MTQTKHSHKDFGPSKNAHRILNIFKLSRTLISLSLSLRWIFLYLLDYKFIRLKAVDTKAYKYQMRGDKEINVFLKGVIMRKRHNNAR